MDWPVAPGIKPNCGVSQNLVHIGPGTNDSVTPTQDKFGPAQAPGIEEQPNYFSAGCMIPFDFRDKPGFTHKGTAVFLGARRFNATNDRFSFTRVSAAAEQYIPFFNKKRVIALRAATELSYHDSNQVVPFYMQTMLGGEDDLRGFRPRRFYDENSFYMNGEYRWEICTGLDMAVFADAGRVFHRPWQISLDNLHTSAGFGIRLNDMHTTVIRLDTGFSREGFQVWFVFNKVF
jgi:outer membrane protein assembly factor BamA